MVGSCDVRFPIRLEGLGGRTGIRAVRAGVVSGFDLDKLPNRAFDFPQEDCGGERREDIYQTFENIYPVLTEFKKLQLSRTSGRRGWRARAPRRFRRLGREEGNQKLLIKICTKRTEKENDTNN